MGRPSKLADENIRRLIDQLMVEHPEWGSRKLSNEMKVRHNIKISHVAINDYKNGNNYKKENEHKSVQLTKVVAQKAVIHAPADIPKVEIKYIEESEFMDIQQVFNQNDRFLYDVLQDKDIEIRDKLRAVAIRYLNATSYSRVTGHGLSAKEVEKYQNLISELEQESVQQTNRILEAVKKVVPDSYFAKIAEVL